MRPGRYILVDRKPVPCADLIDWAVWYEKGANRLVAKTRVGGAEVSTIFLGLDMDPTGEGPPILWETMVFGGKHNRVTVRCAGTWEQAEAMHQEMVNRVKASKTVTKAKK